MTQVDLFSSPAGLPASREVAQHNHLIFAPFALGSLESIIFISMLERISRTDTVFQEWKIPVTDILPHRNGHYFELLKKARENLVGNVVDIAPVQANGKRSSKPRTIIYKCDHDETKGYIICQFHDHMREYLLKLLGNFTKADLSVLKTFKDEKSVRFYWMLKSRFYNSNAITITVEECRKCLLPKESTAYPYPNDLKKHILVKLIHKELSSTDCAFDIGDTLKKGNATIGWHFIRREGSCLLIAKKGLNLTDELTSLLKTLGIDKKGLHKISELMGKNIGGVKVDENYIGYVASERSRAKQSKGDAIVNLAGYIVDTIGHGWLSESYQNHLKGISVGPARKPAAVYKQPVSEKRASSGEQESKWISMGEAEAMYEQEKGAGKTRYPLPGFIKALKTGRNIVVEGFKY